MKRIQETIEQYYRNMTKKHFVLFVLAVVLLYGLYFFGFNPAKKMAEMRNSQRRADVVSILNVVYQYSQQHDGEIPSMITENPAPICRSAAKSCQGMIDLGEIVTSEKKLISRLPVDPHVTNENSTGYEIFRTASGRLAVSAPLAENKAAIMLSK